MPAYEATLRPAQREVLHYSGGRLGISAVPGSGKTFTLEALIAELVIRRGVPPERIGVFTFMRSSRANLTGRINRQLWEGGVAGRLEAFTLHSLALKVLQHFQGQLGLAAIDVLEGYEQERFISRLTQAWLRNHCEIWEPLLPPTAEAERAARNRAAFGRSFKAMCREVIRTAKNYRLPPQAIEPVQAGFLTWALGIYRSYQTELLRTGKLDYDDLAWRAVDLIERDAGVRGEVEGWYDYLFEDESQDSSPLQERLLDLLSARSGNLVRVGDPNQSIMSTFTTAEPRFFRRFCRLSRPVVLEESSRSAPMIIALANALVDWAASDHPNPSLRGALVRQHIRTASSGPANPGDSEAAIHFDVVSGPPEEEIAAVAHRAAEALAARPEHSFAVLVGTNELGAQVLRQLQRFVGVRILDLLRSNPTQRELIDRLRVMAEFFAQPSSPVRLAAATEALADWAGLGRRQVAGAQPRLLRIAPEKLLFPVFGSEISLPVAAEEQAAWQRICSTLAGWLLASRSPWADSLRLVVQTLYRSSAEIYLGHYVVDQLERSLGERPAADWQEVADEIQAILDGSLNNLPSEAFHFTPEPGAITVATAHRAKGLEWDEVFLTGISAYEYPVLREDRPVGLYFLDGLDMRAEALSELRASARLRRRHTSATERAFLDLAAEKLRLLYVGITRARRRLVLSVATRDLFGREQKPSRLFQVLQCFDSRR
ncbi:ATP-dependent helicase [Gloeobacter morelensis]|uniref:DNA 3'-5' helicase n=1 Tax=Gloeobacter morelensis MG652769 TaxID=2781736 RepID=A0ABY3PLF6_9CYAN|nr:ATP-dependent helicase [Gloeobacter morelensis]UFP94450.1 ATP-dependent helicase [Gloeobacter morelensis MG652769]